MAPSASETKWAAATRASLSLVGAALASLERLFNYKARRRHRTRSPPSGGDMLAVCDAASYGGAGRRLRKQLGGKQQLETTSLTCACVTQTLRAGLHACHRLTSACVFRVARQPSSCAISVASARALQCLKTTPYSRLHAARFRLATLAIFHFKEAHLCRLRVFVRSLACTHARAFGQDARRHLIE